MFGIFRLPPSFRRLSEFSEISGTVGTQPPDSACASALIHGDFLLNARFPGIGPLLAKSARKAIPPVLTWAREMTPKDRSEFGPRIFGGSWTAVCVLAAMTR
jgi:hypothetical protein